MAFDVEDGPRIRRSPERPTLGIRLVTPFRGMLAVRDALIAELSEWMATRGVEAAGPFFLRLHTVDMSADMDIEVGVLDTIDGADGSDGSDGSDGRVRAGAVPAGDYALLAYRGSSLQANRMLLAWAPEQGRRFDADLASGAWAGRLEILKTDPRTEPRKTRWTIELAFLLEPAA